MHGVGTGSILGGRYLAKRRLLAGVGYERWDAIDQQHQRQVTLLVWPAATRHTATVLDAARRAASVDDTRLVRVLDVGVDAPIAYVVEDVQSHSVVLADVLNERALPADEVRRICGESAMGLERARARGLHHGVLTPLDVLRDPDGAIRIRGLATTAVLLGRDDRSSDQASRDDAVALVAVAYACFTMRWPIPDARIPAGIEPAPAVVGGVPAPSELAAGVPGDLDAIARQTFGRDLGPVSPGDLANQIAPWSSKPLDIRAMASFSSFARSRTEDTTPLRRTPPPALIPAADPELGQDASPAGVTSSEDAPSTAESSSVIDAAPLTSGAAAASSAPPVTSSPAEAPAQGRESDRTSPPAGPASLDTPSAEPPAEPAAGPDPSVTDVMPAAHPSPPEAASSGVPQDSPDSQGPSPASVIVRSGVAAVAAGASAVASGASAGASAVASGASAGASAVASSATAVATSAGVAAAKIGSLAKAATSKVTPSVPSVLVPSPDDDRPLPILPESTAYPPSGDQSKWALAIVAAIVVAATIFAVQNLPGFNLGAATSQPTSTPGATAGPTPTASATASATAEPAASFVRAPLKDAKGVDPRGDGVEGNDSAGRALDANPATTWRSEGYGSPEFGGLKPGVGWSAALATPAKVHAVRLTVPRAQDVTVYAGPSRSLQGATKVGSKKAARGTFTLTTSGPGIQARYVIVWVTRVSADSGGRYRAELGDVRVTVRAD